METANSIEMKKMRKREINKKYREKKKQEETKKEIASEIQDNETQYNTDSNDSDDSRQSIVSYSEKNKRHSRRQPNNRKEDSQELSLNVLNQIIDKRLQKMNKYTDQQPPINQYNPQYPYPQYPQYPHPQYPQQSQQSSSFLDPSLMKTIAISALPILMSYFKVAQASPNQVSQSSSQSAMPSQQQNQAFHGLNSI
jgi:hypothetical protein